VKNKIRKLVGEKNYLMIATYKINLVNYFILLNNYWVDFKLYVNYSNVFNMDSFEKVEAKIILYYHSLEKGLIHENIRFKFGRQNVLLLLEYLKRKEVIEKINYSQVSAAVTVLCDYYKLHKKNNIDISDYFTNSDYEQISGYSNSNCSSTKMHNKSSYFKNSNENFLNFSFSRNSVRDYTGEIISEEKIQNVIELAKNAPSVCNRQPVKVYFVDNKVIVDEILDIQQGLKGYSDKVSQLLVVVSDRSYFYTIGERSQLFIDGGIFLMNLLYSLHFYKIAACPAHWGLDNNADAKIQKVLKLTSAEKVISLVAIGIPENEFKTCSSKRRHNNEVLKIVK